MAELPSGTVTFMFTDIEGSTARWEHQPEAMRVALARHDALVRAAIVEHGGHVVKTMGDAFHAAFARAPDAVLAALDGQRRLQAEPWGEIGQVRVRMALHTGAAEERDGDYFGPPLNRAACLLSAGHGGQVLLSQVTSDLVRDNLPDRVDLIDLGEHRLKDLIRPERVFQLTSPNLPTDFPPLLTLNARPNNLATHPTALLGREREVAAVSALLRAMARLVTLTGPGGTGKTRLGLHVAAELTDAFHDGVFFVDLAPISDPALVLSTVAQTLGLRDVGGRPALDALADFLRERQLLLLLDNFEQILPAAAGVAALLGACPDVKVLVTSRARLHLRGEHEFPLAPLGLPEPGRRALAVELATYPAVSLFTQRATEVRPDFILGEENAAGVAEICRRLDGLPLAIELAAARVKLLVPLAILARLEQRLPLLTGGARDLPARQRTLRDTIAWSYDLLDESERRLFRCLAAFVGGCTIDAAEAVCGLGSDLGIEVLDGITSLVDNNLLRKEDGPDGEPRIGMLETIREYALEQLALSGESEATRRRHAAFFLSFAEKAEPGLRSAEQAIWLTRLELEHDNLRAALAWSQTRDDALDLALRLAAALAWFWYVHGHVREGRTWLDTTLDRTSGCSPTVRAKALAGNGLLTLRLAEYGRASVLLEEALSLYRAAGDMRGIGWCYSLTATVARELGDYERATMQFEESARLLRAAGDPSGLGWALGSHGLMAGRLGDYDRAATLHEESLVAFRQGGNSHLIARGLSFLGLVEHGRGDHDRAESLLNESIGLLRDLGDSWAVAQALSGLGRVALAQGDGRRAEALHREALSIYLDLGHKVAIAGCLDDLASVATYLDAGWQASRLLGAADALRALIGVHPTPTQETVRQRTIASVRVQLPEPAYVAALGEGQEMNMDQAIDYALGEPSSA